MSYNFAADSFQTKKLCSRHSSSEVQFYMENGRFVFLSPPLGGLGAMCRLTGKRVVDFLLVLIELFSLGEVLPANIGSKSAILLQPGPVDPKFQVEGVTPTSTILLRKVAKLPFIWDKIWTDLSSGLSQCTRLTDKWTDSFLPTRPPCIQCSAVKMSTYHTSEPS